jgi:PAS domain S-box-containing protein
MDWHAVAAALSEGQVIPVLALDSDAKIQLFNRAFEQLSGWDRSEVVGASWVQRFVPAERAQAANARLAEAFRGALRKYDCHVVTRDRRTLRLSVEFSLVGRRDGGALMVTVTDSAAVQDLVPGQDVDYEVSADPADFGTIRRLALMGVEVSEAVGQKCYRMLHNRTVECDVCPLRTSDAAPWPREAVRCGDKRFQVTTAAVATGGAKVSVRCLSESILSGMIHAKMESIAEKAGMSRRELEVLTHLVDGRSLEEIAAILDIRVRTVKFHQANALEKLGADSRIDLMRLLF